MKSEKEKAEEILKKREQARKGFSETNDDGKDPIEEQEDRAKKVADAGLAVGLGLRRSG